MRQQSIPINLPIWGRAAFVMAFAALGLYAIVASITRGQFGAGLRDGLRWGRGPTAARVNRIGLFLLGSAWSLTGGYLAVAILTETNWHLPIWPVFPLSIGPFLGAAIFGHSRSR